MKAKIIIMTAIFIFMGIIPVIAINGGVAETNAPVQTNTPDTAEEKPSEIKNLSNEEILSGLVFAQFRENYNEETLKAISVILQTNYKADPSAFDFTDESVYYSKEAAKNQYKNSYEKINKKITAALNSVKGIYAYYENEPAYIPFSKCSSGCTEADEKYPYLLCVASPWDCQSENYSEDNTCVGVSLDGIKHLTNNGCDCVTALKWYLPALEIK